MSPWVEVDHAVGSPAVDELADIQRRGDIPSHGEGDCHRCGLKRLLFRFTQTRWLMVGGQSVDSEERVLHLCIRCFSHADADVEEEACW